VIQATSKSRHGHDYNIFKNPSFALSENTRRTNTSLRISTYFIAIATFVNVVVATISLFKNNDGELRMFQQSIDRIGPQIDEIKKVQGRQGVLLLELLKTDEKDSSFRGKNAVISK
jgi:hypothetical protein